MYSYITSPNGQLSSGDWWQDVVQHVICIYTYIYIYIHVYIYIYIVKYIKTLIDAECGNMCGICGKMRALKKQLWQICVYIYIYTYIYIYIYTHIHM